MRHTKTPIIDEITMVMPVSIQLTHVDVELLEYPGLTGIILLSELSRKRFRSVHKIVTVGKMFPAIVTSIDTNGYISLSKKNLSETEISQAFAIYQQLKHINNIVNNTVTTYEKIYNKSINADLVYDIFIWSLSNNTDEILSALVLTKKFFDKIYDMSIPNELVTNELIDSFKRVINNTFKDQEILIETIMEITCYEDDGIVIIRNILITASEMATVEVPFTIRLIKSPQYSISVKTLNQKEAINLITTVSDYVYTGLMNAKANCIIKQKPQQLTNDSIPEFLADRFNIN